MSMNEEILNDDLISAQSDSPLHLIHESINSSLLTIGKIDALMSSTNSLVLMDITKYPTTQVNLSSLDPITYQGLKKVISDYLNVRKDSLQTELTFYD